LRQELGDDEPAESSDASGMIDERPLDDDE
jgi:hypothetical protein